MAIKVLSMLLLPALLVACNPFGLRDLLEAATRSPLSIDPTDVTMPAGATLTFAADGGVPGYTYSATNGSIDLTTGVYTAPLSAGTATITVTDAAGATATTGVTIEELITGLSLSPSSITVTVNSEVQFTAVGGTGPYSFDFTAANSGSPDINTGTGYYVAGSNAGIDTVEVTDFLGATAPATVTVVALASAVDYSVTSTAGLPASGVAGDPIPGGLSFTVTNAGPGNGAAAIDWRVYLSANAALDGGDVVVDEGTTAALVDDGSVAVDLSGMYPTGPTGAGFLIVTVDAADDTSPGNNTSAASAFTLQPRPVDCHVPLVNHFTGAITGQTVTGDFTVHNQGTAAGSSTIYWYVYASTDTTVDGSDYLLQSGSLPALAAGASAVIGISSTWPTAPAFYRLLVRVSAVDDVNTGNDTGWTSQVDVQGAPPDNIDYQVDPPSSVGTVAGGPVTGSFDVTNAGSVAGSKTVYWTVYRSPDATLETGTDPIVAMGSRAGLAPATPTPVAYSGTWPAGAATWWLFATVSALDDIDPGNNASSSAMVSVTAPNVDYMVQSFNETSGLVAGDPITGTFIARNSGTSAGSQTLSWTVYLSEDATLDPVTDLVVDAGTFPALGAGAATALTPYDGTWPTSPYPPWAWRLYLVLSAADETDPPDNTSGTILRTTVAPNADYYVVSVSSTGGTTAGYPLTGTFNATNLGPHDGTQAVPWRAYLSTNADYDPGVDMLIDSGIIASPGLTVGSFTGVIAFDGIWPEGSGSWYLVVVLDAGDDANAVNNDTASGLVATTAPDVNYDVISVNNTGTLVAGGPLDGTFTFQNIGSDDGSKPVAWIAYRSDDAIFNPGTDTVIDSGVAAALASGAGSAAISVENEWPYDTVSHNYWIIVAVLAADDIVPGNDAMMVGPVTVNPPNINYDVIVINNTGLLVAGGALAGMFQVQNIGSVNGSATLYWDVYRSLDLVFTAGVDPAIDSGSIPGGLTAGNTANPTFAGTWPESGVPVTYYYFVKVFAADDISAANDEQFSAACFVAAGAPDYRVVNTTFNGTGTPGAALTGTNQFQIQNAAANPGAKTITWRAYASLDTVLDGSDTLLATSSIGPLGASATSALIPFGGTWPAFGSYYRLIVSLDADDDTNPANDTLVSSDVTVPENHPEGTGNDDGAYPFPSVPALGTILPYQLVQVSGTMDLAGWVDTFRWTAGAGMTRIEMKIKWNTGFDDCDLYFWTTLGTQFMSNDTDVDEEPGGTRYTIYGLTPGNEYYTAAYFYLDFNTSGSTGQPYKLLLYGTP